MPKQKQEPITKAIYHNDNISPVEIKPKINSDQWQCKTCTMINSNDLPYCEACTSKRVDNQHKSHNSQSQ